LSSAEISIFNPKQRLPLARVTGDSQTLGQM
jgi:hypothetical protein